MKPKTILKKSIFVLVIAILFSQFSYSLFPRYETNPDYDIWSCANHDGSCQDIPNYLCTLSDFWTMMNPLEKTKYCNQFEQYQLGCCSIRKAKQILPKQYFECVSLCKDTGFCQCSIDLRYCFPTININTWYWYPEMTVCPQSYSYINE